MIITLQMRRLGSIGKIRAFVGGYASVDHELPDRENACSFVGEQLRRLGYRGLASGTRARCEASDQIDRAIASSHPPPGPPIGGDGAYQPREASRSGRCVRRMPGPGFLLETSGELRKPQGATGRPEPAHGYDKINSSPISSNGPTSASRGSSELKDSLGDVGNTTNRTPPLPRPDPALSTLVEVAR